MVGLAFEPVLWLKCTISCRTAKDMNGWLALRCVT